MTADLSPTGLVVLGPLLVGIGVVHFLTALWWYDRLSPRWRHRRFTRASATANRWFGAAFLIAMGMSALAVGIARLT